jgi:hypothetical protein
MASIGDTTRPEYIYDQATDTWIPVGIGPHSHTPAAIGAISNSLTTTTGDLIYASSANTPARLGIGSTGQVLSVSGGVPAWATPNAGTWTTFNPTIKQNVTVSSTNYGSQYFVSGDFVFVQVNKIMGNAGTANNEIKITLPVASTSTHLLGDGMPAGTCYIWDYSSNNYYQGFVTMYQPTEVTLTSGLNKPLSTLTWGKTSSDCPITLAPDDIVSAIFSYRKA